MFKKGGGVLMRKVIFYLIIIFLTAGICLPVLAEDDKSFEKILTIAEVEKISGYKGVQFLSKNLAEFLGGDMNFMFMVKEKKQILFAVNFESLDKYAVLKQNYFKTKLKGIGEEAFSGKNTTIKASDRVVFRKGIYSVNILCGKDWDAGGKPWLTVEQMSAIAKIIASKIKK
jgi:hypothetical protein